MKKNQFIALCTLFALGTIIETALAAGSFSAPSTQQGAALQNQSVSAAETKTLKKGGNIAGQTRAMTKTDGTINQGAATRSIGRRNIEKDTTNKNFGQKVETKSNVKTQY